MINRIDRLYEQGRPLPVQKTDPAKQAGVDRKMEAGDIGMDRRQNVAERIAPHLHDQVEISEQAREASRADAMTGLPYASPVPEQTIHELQDSWYATGYQQALDQFDAMRGPQG
ncbi:hypothetical protein KQI52_16205 [bacterium]|nr:hypothetical protein [bacterium]